MPGGDTKLTRRDVLEYGATATAGSALTAGASGTASAEEMAPLRVKVFFSKDAPAARAVSSPEIHYKTYFKIAAGKIADRTGATIEYAGWERLDEEFTGDYGDVRSNFRDVADLEENHINLLFYNQEMEVDTDGDLIEPPDATATHHDGTYDLGNTPLAVVNSYVKVIDVGDYLNTVFTGLLRPILSAQLDRIPVNDVNAFGTVYKKTFMNNEASPMATWHTPTPRTHGVPHCIKPRDNPDDPDNVEWMCNHGEDVAAACDFSNRLSNCTVEAVKSQLEAVAEQEDIAPIPEFTRAPDYPDPGELVRFDASESGFPDIAGKSDIEAYRWEFGDGDEASGVEVTHRYDSPGVYDVTLTVEGEYGTTDDTTDQVVVGESGQIAAQFTVDDEVNVGEEVTFQPSTDRHMSEYEWHFGDGETEAGSGIPQEVTHTYDSPGTYEVVFEVTGDPAFDTIVGTHAAVQEIEVAVDNEEPAAAISVGTDDPDTDEIVQFDATGSRDPDGRIDSFEWDFGDGSSATGESVTHSYDTDGLFTVGLTVTDNDTFSESVTRELVVGNPNHPGAQFEANPASPEVGESVAFEGPSGLIYSFHEYEWHFGDGTTASGIGAPGEVSHTYDEAGTYTVALRVTPTFPLVDGDDAVATREIEVGEPRDDTNGNGDAGDEGGDSRGESGTKTDIDGGETVEKELTPSESSDQYSYSPTDSSAPVSDGGSTPENVAITLDVPRGSDFDLFVTLDGRPPSPTSYDYRSTTGGSTERILLDEDDLGGTEVRIAVAAYSGGGVYELEIDEEG